MKIANRIWPSWKQLSRDLIHFISSKTIKWNIYIYKVKFVLWHRHLVLNLSLSNRQRVTNQSWASTSMASPSRASQSVGHMSITTRREGSRSRQYSPQNGIWLVPIKFIPISNSSVTRFTIPGAYWTPLTPSYIWGWWLESGSVWGWILQICQYFTLL